MRLKLNCYTSTHATNTECTHTPFIEPKNKNDNFNRNPQNTSGVNKCDQSFGQIGGCSFYFIGGPSEPKDAHYIKRKIQLNTSFSISYILYFI